MNIVDFVRANNFDHLVGVIQTNETIYRARGQSLLDIGCGIGQYTPKFLERFSYVTGLDSSQDCLAVAKKNNDIINYVLGDAESFSLDYLYDTINLNMILEHVNDPVKVLINCKKHLADEGVIICQVPNSNSITRRLGVIMGVIDGIDHMSEKEISFFGHKRTYTLNTLSRDCQNAGLSVLEKGGLVYKPLPNEELLKICNNKSQDWIDNFLSALLEFGRDKPEDCAVSYTVCTH